MGRLSFLLLFVFLVIIHQGQATRGQWEQEGRASSSSIITVRLALQQRNLDILEATLLDVSDPHSASYGKWWAASDITELVAPSKEVSESIVSFLKREGEGAVNVGNFRDMIKLSSSVQFIESLFQTQLFVFRHTTKTSKTIIRAVGEHVIPSEIRSHVDFVAGLYEFPNLPAKTSQPAEIGAGVDGYVVPYVINNLYNIPANFTSHPNSSICLAEFQDDASYSKADLKEFSTQNGIPDITVAHVVGPFSSSNPDAEATLDVEFGAAIAQSTTVWYWTEKVWMYDFATDFIATKNPPLVVSMSWGWPEPEQCQVGTCSGGETSLQYVQRTNVEFQKIGLMGTTLVAASGDQGAPGDSNPDCSGTGKKALSSIFPGASPWVLSVGATMLENTTSSNSVDDKAAPPICQTHTCSNSTTELVCTYPEALITTGGGFSNYVPTPSYQQTVVSSYLSSGVPLPPKTAFNQSNRGFPDVSALGHNYLIRLSGDFEQVDGTSCSSPVVAAMIALLNSYRLNNNKAPLGFVIPVIYQAYAADPTIFNDITEGDNKCTESCCAKVGYEATKGWDPVTGLGTPNFAKLLNYIKTLP